MIMPIVDVVPKRRSLQSFHMGWAASRAISLSACRVWEGSKTLRPQLLCGEMLDPEQQPLILAR